ncbi:uncharacterized protein LAJ45_07813 [Morchella importuna]|uniref:uncharacterized protein n=1 Tax=Morchella importuna TaxID=1174673 RepID=UPI001E8DA144|nr:uncharacterized protein LAJ45_07813 [Morchella importuna]KAH8148049.1 hypothetical protein LAJ45_07813 [Morchella importuna]
MNGAKGFLHDAWPGEAQTERPLDCTHWATDSEAHEQQACETTRCLTDTFEEGRWKLLSLFTGFSFFDPPEHARIHRTSRAVYSSELRTRVTRDPGHSINAIYRSYVRRLSFTVILARQGLRPTTCRNIRGMAPNVNPLTGKILTFTGAFSVRYHVAVQDYRLVMTPTLFFDISVKLV